MRIGPALLVALVTTGAWTLRVTREVLTLPRNIEELLGLSAPEQERLAGHTVELLASLQFPGSLSGRAKGDEAAVAAEARDEGIHAEALRTVAALLSDVGVKVPPQPKAEEGEAARAAAARALYRLLLSYLVVQHGVYATGADPRFVAVWESKSELVWSRYEAVQGRATDEGTVAMPLHFAIELQVQRIRLLQVAGTLCRVDDKWTRGLDTYNAVLAAECPAGLQEDECLALRYVHALIGTEMRGAISLEFSGVTPVDNSREKFAGVDQVFHALMAEHATQTLTRLGRPEAEVGPKWATAYMTAIIELLKRGAFNAGRGSRFAELWDGLMDHVYSVSTFLDMSPEKRDMSGKLTKMPDTYKPPFYKALLVVLKGAGVLPSVRAKWATAAVLHTVAFGGPLSEKSRDFYEEMLVCFMGDGRGKLPYGECQPSTLDSPLGKVSVDLALSMAGKGKKRERRAKKRVHKAVRQVLTQRA